MPRLRARHFFVLGKSAPVGLRTLVFRMCRAGNAPRAAGDKAAKARTAPFGGLTPTPSNWSVRLPARVGGFCAVVAAGLPAGLVQIGIFLHGHVPAAGRVSPRRR